MALADFFPANDIQAINDAGSLSFHAMGDSGVGSPEQHDVADAMCVILTLVTENRVPHFYYTLEILSIGLIKRRRTLTGSIAPTTTIII